MGQLDVRPDDLDRFAGTMNNLADQAGSAKDYVSEWFNVGPNDTRIFDLVAGTLAKVRADLESNYTKLQDLAAASGAELAKAGQFYRTTDGATARQLDATYPGGSK